MRTTTVCLAALSIVFLLLVSGCSFDGPSVHGTGPVVSETRTVGTFLGVELAGDAQVVIAEGETPEVKVEAQRNILDVLKTDVHGETLRIGYDHVSVGSHERVKVYVTTPVLRDVSLPGSGSITSGATWRSETFRANLSGSGKLDLRVTAVRDLHATLSGSGDIKLAGDAVGSSVTISGSGNVRAFDLQSQDTAVTISGSGSADVNATRSLLADITGSGSVRYRGSPKVMTHISGSGSVHPNN
jgi:hypothetical protein